jgi:ferric-dicitrate binding protein FerR (iron transport regulator)
MSSAFAPIDPATISALNAGDERALETIFRDHFAWILERSLERLKGENAAAPRLIVGTVREFWEERDGFHTSAEVEAFFNEELRHRARAVRARMTAVHRFEKAEGVHAHAPAAAPTVDQLWTDIATALHQPVVDAATAAKQRRQHAKHEVAEHITEVTKSGSWKTPVVIVTVATIVALAGAWYMTQSSRAEVVNQLLGSAEAEAITTRAGQMGSATLNDSSTARLAPETRLVVVPRFGRDYRTLSVGGAAQFTVASGNEQTFDARVGDLVVRSTGGTFTVRDYADEQARLIRADAGPLEVRMATGNRTLAEGEILRIARDGTVDSPPEAEVLQAFAWTDGRLVLSEATVREAAQQLWRWYGMDIEVADSSVAAQRISLSVPLESSQGAIAAIEGSAPVRFAWVDGQMTFQPAVPPRGR